MTPARPRLGTLLTNAARLTCPLCGVTPLFRPLRETTSLSAWLHPEQGCTPCGYRYEREPGYFLLAIWGFDYFAGALTALAVYLLLELLFELPLPLLLVCVTVPAALTSLLLLRHAKAFFLAIDRFIDP